MRGSLGLKRWSPRKLALAIVIRPIRSLLIVSVFAALVSWAVPSWALSGVTVQSGAGPGQIVITVSGGGGSAKSGSSDTKASSASAPAVPSIPKGGGNAASYGVSVVSPPNQNPCVLSVRGLVNSGGGVSIGVSADLMLQRYLINTYGICKAGSGTVVHTVTPAQVADSLWSQHIARQLPSPRPSIPPGYGVVGITSYLLANDPNTATFSLQTSLGTLSISATATYLVSFDGGGTYFGPFSNPGAAWPVGGIDHIFANPGYHQVQVVENWSGTWALGGVSGGLPPLETTGTLADFQVYSLVALRVD